MLLEGVRFCRMHFLAKNQRQAESSHKERDDPAAWRMFIQFGQVEVSTVRYRIGIDPGERFIGIAVVGMENDDVAVPIHLAFVDLKGDPHQTDIRKLVKARADHRRARRTRKAHRQRIAEIRKLLQGIPADQANRVIALCRRRGWRPDSVRDDTRNGSSATNASEDDAAEIRRPREEVLAALRQLIPQAAPTLSADALNEILAILDRRSPAKIHNRRVGSCGREGCQSKRAKAADYPVLWLAEAVLTHLQPQSREDARRFFLLQLGAEGWDLRSGSYAAFRCQSPSERQAAFQAAKKAWRTTKRIFKLPDGVVENVDRVIEGMDNQLRRAIHGESSNRLSMCPMHWFERVRVLAAGKAAPQASGGQPGHSLVWEAVEAKIASYLKHRVLPHLPPDAVIESVTIERDAFDLMWSQGKRKPLSREVADRIRWRGPYVQLRFLAPEGSSFNKLLAAETGNLCAICGKPLGKEIDRAHLLPQGLVGGYPYLAIVAAHPSCNQRMGTQILRVDPRAVEAMRKVRQQIQRKHGAVHIWFIKKLGILNALATFSNEQGPPPVLRFMQRAFATPQATMQSSDRLANALQAAIMEAGRGEPEVRRRAATEVARARQVAVSAGSDAEETEPWFIKEVDKDSGSILNHAIDAFVVAAIPPAQPVFSVHGDRASGWEMSPDRIVKRLAILRSREAWDQATQAAWYPAPERPISVMSLTMRRVWRQSYVNDTRIRQRQGGGAYRQPAQKWLDGLKDSKRKKDPDKLRSYIANLQFAPLRAVAIQAMEAAKPEDAAAAVRAAVISFLKQETSVGLDGAQPAPTDGHPVREARIKALRDWVKCSDISQPVPPWISVTLKEDRMLGAEERRLRVRQGFQNLMSFAMALWVLAIHAEGKATLFGIEPDGELSYQSGRKCIIDAAPLRQAIPVKPITPLAPQVKAWRQTAAALLRQAGYVRGWIVARGSVLKTIDGQEFLLETKEETKKTKAPWVNDVTGVLPGRGWLLFEEEGASPMAK